PFIPPEFDRAAGFIAGLRHARAGLLRIVGLGGLLPGPFFGLVLGLLVLGSRFRFLDEILFANVLTIIDADHHNHVIGFLLSQRIARDVPPVEIAFRVVTQ